MSFHRNAGDAISASAMKLAAGFELRNSFLVNRLRSHSSPSCQLRLDSLTIPMATQKNDTKQEKPIAGKTIGLLVQSSRGDKTPLELFLTGVQAWSSSLRRTLSNGSP
jgi:hypothetical protein